MKKIVLLVLVLAMMMPGIVLAAKPPTWDTYSDPQHNKKDNVFKVGEPIYIFGNGYIPNETYTIVLSNDNGDSFYYKTWKPAKVVGELAEEVVTFLPSGHWISIVFIGVDNWFEFNKVSQTRFQVKE